MDTPLDKIFDQLHYIPEDFEVPDGFIYLIEWAQQLGVLDIVMDMVRDRYLWDDIYRYIYEQDKMMSPK